VRAAGVHEGKASAFVCVGIHTYNTWPACRQIHSNLVLVCVCDSLLIERLFSSSASGRIHSAVVSGINPETRSVTVEWFERGETKGKEVSDHKFILGVLR
jgi:hypothetical protein